MGLNLKNILQLTSLRRLAPLMLVLVVACAPLTGCHSSKGSAKGKPRVERPHGTHRPDHKKPEKAKGDKVTEALVAEARNWIGTPYVYGGASYDGADCSGFLQTLYSEVADIKLPRTSRQQREFCTPVRDKERAVGDILFFASKKSGGRVTHVGMYIGGNRMIHSSSSRGVIEEDLSLRYYQTYYLGAGRVPALADVKRPGKSKKNKDKGKPAPVAPPAKPAPQVPVPAAEITLDELIATSAPQAAPAVKQTPPPAPESVVEPAPEPAPIAVARPVPEPAEETISGIFDNDPQPAAKPAAKPKPAPTPAAAVRNAFNRK